MSRIRQVASSISAAYLRFVVTSVCSLVAVPIYLHFLGKEEYGLWLAVLSVLMPLSLTSLGFPTISQNMLAEARAVEDWDRVNRVLTTSFLFLFATAVLACLLTVLGLHLGAVQAVLKTTPESSGTVVPVLLIALGGFAFSQPLQVFRLGFRAFERVDIEQHGLSILGVANLLLATLVLWRGQGVVGVAAVYTLLQLAGGVVFFALLMRRYSQLRFSPRFFSWELASHMLRPGFHFFVVSLAGVLVWGIDNLVISGVMGVAFVTSYAIAARLVQLLVQLIATPFNTLIPTITTLHARRDEAAIRHLFFLSTKLSLSAAILFSVELAFFGRSFIVLWADRSVLVSETTFLALVAILAINVVVQPAYAFIIATTRHRTYSWLSLAAGIANVTLSLWWIREWGVFGVALGTLVPQLLISGAYLAIAGTRMYAVGFSDLWSRHARLLTLPALSSIAAAFVLRGFSTTWIEWGFSTGVTLLVFLVTCWFTATTPEERTMLLAALRTA